MKKLVKTLKALIILLTVYIVFQMVMIAYYTVDFLHHIN